MTTQKSTRTIDINCDIGEGFGNWSMGADAEIMPLITTANIACGFHAGDPVIMDRTVAMAAEHGVVIGAHPGYQDLVGFGRRQIQLSPEEAAATITYQVGALIGFLTARGLELNHVKPHGAFYAFLRDNPSAGEAAALAVHKLAPETRVYWPAPTAGAVFAERLAALGHDVVGDLYPDLTYARDGKLILQKQKLKTDVEFAVSQVKRFLAEGVIEAEDGTAINHPARSICIHSDGPNALEVAHAVRDAIANAGFDVAPVGA